VTAEILTLLRNLRRPENNFSRLHRAHVHKPTFVHITCIRTAVAIGLNSAVELIARRPTGLCTPDCKCSKSQSHNVDLHFTTLLCVDSYRPIARQRRQVNAFISNRLAYRQAIIHCEP